MREAAKQKEEEREAKRRQQAEADAMFVSLLSSVSHMLSFVNVLCCTVKVVVNLAGFLCFVFQLPQMNEKRKKVRKPRRNGEDEVSDVMNLRTLSSVAYVLTYIYMCVCVVCVCFLLMYV